MCFLPSFVCDVHGVPAIRRRCSHGQHKDRRFYVCGLDRKDRCNYFKWSDEVPTTSIEGGTKQDSQMIFPSVLKELQQFFSGEELQQQLCDLISEQFENYHPSASQESVNEDDLGPKFPSLKTDAERLREIEDGLQLVREKSMRPFERSVSSKNDADESRAGTHEAFLSSALELCSLLAPKSTSADMSESQGWSSNWLACLCEIITTSSSKMLRTFASTTMLQLVGGRQETYNRIRDHYCFGAEFRKLLLHSQDILDAALVVREQARQCGNSWREEEVSYESLSPSGLIGVGELISEDWYSKSTQMSISGVLDELLSIAGRSHGTSRTNHWRQFCGLPMAFKSHTTPNEILQSIHRRPPIISLLWLVCSLNGTNQVKALKLTEIGLDDASTPLVALNNMHGNPCQCLMEGFTADDLFAFINLLVLHGRTKEVRSVSANVSKKLATSLADVDKNILFHGLIRGPFQAIGQLGSNSNNFVDFLKYLVECLGGSNLDLKSASGFISSAFLKQMTCQNQLPCKSSKPDERQDLSDCVHCHNQNLAKRKGKKSTPDIAEEDEDAEAAHLPEQVRPYKRTSLEAATAATAFDEFSIFSQLQYRVALSQVHLTVSDARGRFVKTVGVYYTPRQVSEVSVLKSTTYAGLWQKCGTISLPRGASEASVQLDAPVIAANLKFTFEDFYEKNNNKRSGDGSFVLYCPRCSRQVLNAHGVCGNCGEVAFQCRKCRHINYDRLDAFLCVECGYCTSGQFNFDLNIGLALNATAICSEAEFQRSMAMLRIANKRQDDLRNQLKKKITSLNQQQRKKNNIVENLDEMTVYGAQLRRALLGGLPKSGGDDGADSDPKPSNSSSRSGRVGSSSASRARRYVSVCEKNLFQRTQSIFFVAC